MEKMKTGGHGKPYFPFLLLLSFRNSNSGYGAYFGLSIMDRCAACSFSHPPCAMLDAAGRYYKPDCSLEEAVALMAKWVQPRAPVD